MSIKPSVTTAKVLLHSKHGEYDDCDLWTVEANFARSALAELNTHRMFSRNSASSRAIPVKKMLDQVTNNPFIPRRFSIAQKGMSASEFVEPGDAQWDEMSEWWLDSRDIAVAQVERGLAMNIHKQDVNRILEPFMMHTAIISATDWHNFFDQRLAMDDQGNPLAYPPIYDLAKAISDAMENSAAQTLNPAYPWIDKPAEWHLPLIGYGEDEELSLKQKMQVSVARTARVSYMTHAGVRDVGADILLYDRLTTNGHWSPFEHVAHPSLESGSGNFEHGFWTQLRWYVENGMF